MLIRSRLILLQASRDVTNLSKKVIFLLHRTMTEDMAEHDDRVLSRRAAARAKGKLREIRSLFAAMRPELAGERFARYQRNVSPGLQEYIEALSFAHYLEHRTLISFDAVRGSLCDDEGCPVSLIASPSFSGHGHLTESAVLSSAVGGLSPGALRPDGGAHAFRHCHHPEARRPPKSDRRLHIRA